LLKFIDAQQALSVQVHPHDRHSDLVPPGEQGKTEAWVVLHADPESRIYAGLRAGTTETDMRQALEQGTLQECLHWFTPKPGDCVFIPAGTVHALGAGLVIFEVQQSSDITFRLFDWNRVDAQTRQPRQLHIEQSLACTDYGRGPRSPVVPQRDVPLPAREMLVDCEYFTLWRLCSEQPATVGAKDACRILVCIDGVAEVMHRDEPYPLRRGEVLLLPAEVGSCVCRPTGRFTLLECGLPA
jgi:mannose-6-phosphate isomerase